MVFLFHPRLSQMLAQHYRHKQVTRPRRCTILTPNPKPPAAHSLSRSAQFSLGSLAQSQVVALRLYTTLVYMYMNSPLRDDVRYQQGRACPLPVTTFHAERGIKKLRALHVDAAVQEAVLWRGMRSVRVSDGFLSQGGTELAFMSTTRDLGVAVRYSLSAHSLIFKILVPDFISLGADLQWLSAFPGEAEMLYPPLTYLRPTGRADRVEVDRADGRVCFTVIELRAAMA